MCSANAQGRSPEGAIEWKGNEQEADRGIAGKTEVESKLQDREREGRAGTKDREEGRAAAVKLHFILTDLLYTLISLLKKRKWHSIQRNPFLLELACQPRDEWIQAELPSSGELPLAHGGAATTHSPARHL